MNDPTTPKEDDSFAFIAVGVYSLINIAWYYWLLTSSLDEFYVSLGWFGFKLPLLAMMILIFPQILKCYKLSPIGDTLSVVTIVFWFYFVWRQAFSIWASC